MNLWQTYPWGFFGTIIALSFGATVACSGATEYDVGEVDYVERSARPSLAGDVDLEESELAPVDGHPALGASKPVVTVVMYLEEWDFRPDRYAMLRAAVETHPNRVRIVAKPMLGEQIDSSEASGERPVLLALMAAHRQGEFWKLADHLFEQREEWRHKNQNMGRSDVEEHVEKAGLDMDAFREDFGAVDDHQALLDNTVEAHALNVPTDGLSINGRIVSIESFDPPRRGGRPTAAPRFAGWTFDSFGQHLEVAFEQADEYLEEGGAPEKLYRELVARNHRVFDGVREAQSRRGQPRLEVVQESIEPLDPVIGESDDFLVTVVERCLLLTGPCHESGRMIEELAEEYGDRVRFVIKPRAESHYEGMFVEALLRASRLGRYRQMRRAFADIERRRADPDELEAIIERTGFEPTELEEAIPRDELDQYGRNDHLRRAGWLGESTVATVVINGIVVDGIYSGFSGRYSGPPPRALVRELIDRQLELAQRLRRRSEARGEELYELISDVNAETGYTPPRQVRKTTADADVLDLQDAPAKGPSDASVRVVAMHDFRSEDAKNAHRAFERALDEFDEEVRQYWLLSKRHGRPSPLARLALAADYHDRFWETYDFGFDYHFMGEAEDLTEFAAGRLGMSIDSIDEILERGDLTARLRALADESAKLELEATPAYLVGDQLIHGVAPTETYLEALEEAADAP